MSDPVGDLAFLITGNLAMTCCHSGGAYNKADSQCDCRWIAKDLIENKDKVMEILSRIGDSKE